MRFQFLSWPTGLHSPAIKDSILGYSQRGLMAPYKVTPIIIPKACTMVKGVTCSTQTGVPRKHSPFGVGGKRARDGWTYRINRSTQKVPLTSSSEQFRNTQETLDICRIVICGLKHAQRCLLLAPHQPTQLCCRQPVQQTLGPCVSTELPPSGLSAALIP